MCVSNDPWEWRYWEWMGITWFLNLQEWKPQNVPTPSAQKLQKDSTWISVWGHWRKERFELVQGSPWDFIVPELSWSNCNSCFQPLFCGFSWAASPDAAAMRKPDLCWGGSASAQVLPMGKERSILPPCKGSSLAKCRAREAVGKELFSLCRIDGQRTASVPAFLVSQQSLQYPEI